LRAAVAGSDARVFGIAAEQEQTGSEHHQGTEDEAKAIAEELKGMANVRWENHKALVCLVGEQVRRRPEIASQAFRAISDIEVRMICQGASEGHISFLVDESDAAEAVQRLHRAFFSRPEPAVVHNASIVVCQAEVAWHGAD
jgi:aspartate kinase